MPPCSKCGAFTPDHTAFCATCGAVMDRPDTEMTTAPAAAPAPLPEAPLPEMRNALATPRLSAPALDTGDVGVYVARRSFALLVDLFGAGFLVAVGAFAALTALHDRFAGASWTIEKAIWPAVGAAIVAYFVIAEALFGATLGKGLVGLGVARADGRKIGFGRALVRNALKPLDLCGIGFVIATVTRKRQRFGDFAAGTVVANARIGRLAPLLSIAIAAAISWGAFGWADGAKASQQLVQLARADAARVIHNR